jgi:hypothetical protein
MRGWTAVVFGVLMAGALALVVLKGGRPAAAPATAVADAGVDAAADPTAPAALLDAGDVGEPSSVTAGVDAGGTLLLSGEAPPDLAGDAPKEVTWGCILVQYKGAQGALQPPGNARSRDEALVLARQLVAEAKTDFKAAVAKGDKGSHENLGRIRRGFLEPAPEYVLFSLPKGGVSDPVDTPRGFWIVQRIE